MKVRIIDVKSYNKLSYGQKGLEEFEKLINSRIKEIETEEGLRAVNLYPILSDGDAGGNFEMRSTRSSKENLGSFRFSAAIILL